MSAQQTAAAALIDALREAGVRYLFANFGSDHPAIIEALAADRERGLDTPVVILCPHEYSAMSAAHGVAAVTGEPQAVFVHTDVGTANLGGSVHNAARARVPVFVFAGLTPFTLEDELPGSRNTRVNLLQDAPDQAGLVRPYVKWSYDIRTGRNVRQVVHRALQLARSAPAGPVYLTGAREVLAEEVPQIVVDAAQWPPVDPLAASPAVVDVIRDALRAARNPLIITSYLGRNPAAVELLVALAERYGIAVVEDSAEVMSFPHDHPLHAGDDPHPLLAEADVVIALEVDLPWILTVARPRDDARVFVINDDPLHEDIPLDYVPAERMVRADAATLLVQVLDGADAPDASIVAERSVRLAASSAARRERIAEVARAEREAGRLTASVVGRVLNGLIDADTIVLNEAISEAQTVWKQLPRTRPGTLFGNRGTSLGWSGGGALGVKLARPESTVVSIVGDGTFFFSVPSSTYWIADHYNLAVLTIVLDNGGWNATKRNLTRQHPGEAADRTDRYYVNLQQSADFPGIARAAGGAWGTTVTTVDELEPALREGLSAVQRGIPALVSVRLDAISAQEPETA